MTPQLNELVDALRPFAALLQEGEIWAHAGPDSQPVFAINGAQITLGDLRRARALVMEVA